MKKLILALFFLSSITLSNATNNKVELKTTLSTNDCGCPELVAAAIEALELCEGQCFNSEDYNVIYSAWISFC